MLWLIVLLVQVVNTLASNPDFYNRRHGHKYNRYGAQRHKESAVSIYPRCRSDHTVLYISVVDTSGKPAGKTKLWISSSTGMIDTWTGDNGDAQVTVTGCQVGVIVWRKGKQSKHEVLNLERCTKKAKQVVIQLSIACNFLVRLDGFQRDSGSYQKSDKISYVVTTGGSTSSGSFNGGDFSSPLCFNVKDGDNVYMMISMQSHNVINVLYQSNVKGGTDAWMTVPTNGFLQLEITLKLFRAIFNIWEYDPSTGLSLGSQISRVQIQLIMKSDQFGCTSNSLVCFLSGAPADTFPFIVYLTSEGPDIKGNTALQDRYGNMKIFEFPDEKYYEDTDVWILGCMKGDSLDTIQQTNEIVKEEDVDTDEKKLQYCNKD